MSRSSVLDNVYNLCFVSIPWQAFRNTCRLFWWRPSCLTRNGWLACSFGCREPGDPYDWMSPIRTWATSAAEAQPDEPCITPANYKDRSDIYLEYLWGAFKSCANKTFGPSLWNPSKFSSLAQIKMHHLTGKPHTNSACIAYINSLSKYEHSAFIYSPSWCPKYICL